jgi:alpha-beta hydrolase superfamily lysophospholipase
MGEHSGRYEHVGARLAGHGYDVVAIDHRGHGLSGGRRSHVDGFDEYVVDVEDQMSEVRALGLPVVLLGHSMGGLIATRYVVSGRPAPDLLVLSGPALGAAVPMWMQGLAQVLGRVAPRLPVPGTIDPAVLATDPAVGEAYRADPLVWTTASAGFGRELLAAMADTRAGLHRLGLPTLALHGADDALVPAAASEPLAALSTVERRVLAGLRHEIFNEPVGLALVDDVAAWIADRL